MNVVPNWESCSQLYCKHEHVGFWFDLEMKRLIGRIRPRSPMPSAAAEGSSAPTCSVGSGTVLASILTVLDIAETAVEGLPIYGPKTVISSIRTVLKSVKVRAVNCLHF